MPVGNHAALRRNAQPGSQEATGFQEVGAVRDTASETVLVVDDESMVLEIACKMLRMQGYKVLEARDAREALHICRHEAGPIHLLLTDVMMPETNGWDLAKRVAARRRETRILYMSGYVDPELLPHLRLSADNLVTKPFTADTLIGTVRSALAARAESRLRSAGKAAASFRPS